MSKLFIILFAGLLISGNIGINVYSHFCKHDGVSVSVFVKSEHECDSKKHETKPACCHQEPADDDCCTDEISVAQIAFDYSYHYQNLIPDFEWVAVESDNNFPAFNDVLRNDENIKPISRPPPKSGRDILIQKRVLII